MSLTVLFSLCTFLLLEVIGVAELVNKMNGPWFNRFDEDLATAFSIYCGISIAHVSDSSHSLWPLKFNFKYYLAFLLKAN